jgi:hypothetical protein
MMFATSVTLLRSSPPPLKGRDREGGKRQAPELRFTPLPNPPPQGGRERAAAGGENAQNINLGERRCR